MLVMHGPEDNRFPKPGQFRMVVQPIRDSSGLHVIDTQATWNRGIRGPDAWLYGVFDGRSGLTQLLVAGPGILPLDERGMSAHTPSASGPGGDRILVSWSSANRYAVSATGPCFGVFTKTPDVAVTLGFVYFATHLLQDNYHIRVQD